jgi:hypothetical protein
MNLLTRRIEVLSLKRWIKESKGWLKSTVTKGGLKSTVSKGGLKSLMFNKGKRMVTVHGINKESVKKTAYDYVITSCYNIVYC